VIKVVTGLAFFCGGIPLAVHADEWRFWIGEAESPEQSEMFNIEGIATATSAAAVGGAHVYLYVYVKCYRLVYSHYSGSSE
jgi:hypothetical protein